MDLKYVGDMPQVSQHGVSFDHSQPDRYIYLHAVLELLEALGYGATETTQHLYKIQKKDLSAKELLDGLKRHVKNIDEVMEQKEENAHKFVEDYKDRVRQNTLISEDEREAWLKNIDIMKDYYYQYIANKTVYDAALNALADEITVAEVKEVCIPMFRNYGIVLEDLQKVLSEHKPPINSNFEIVSEPNGIVGIACFSHPKSAF